MPQLETQPRLQEIANVIEKRLFIARVPENTSEDEIREVFSEFGEVDECFITPGRKIAFVRYHSWASAHRALVATDEKKSLTNHTEGQTVTVSFAERTRKVGRGGGSFLAKGSDNSRIFVTSLPADAEGSDVEGLFAKFGTITKVAMMQPKATKRSAFVCFEFWGEALDAIEAFDGSAYPGREDCIMGIVLAEPQKAAGTHRARSPIRPLRPIPHLGPPALAPAARLERPAPPVRYLRPQLGSHDVIQSELDELKDAYLRAIDDGETDEYCSELHEAILACRARFEPKGFGKPSTMNGARPPMRMPIPPKRHEAKRHSRSRSRSLSRPRLQISQLPRECGREELEALIHQVSREMTDCWMDSSRIGCGFAEFSSMDAADDARVDLHDRMVNSWPDAILAEWSSRPPIDRQRKQKRRNGSRSRSPRRGAKSDNGSNVGGRRVFVSKLHSDLATRDLTGLFKTYGEIEECRHLMDKAIAFITFVSDADARAAVGSLEGRMQHGISKDGEVLNVKIAEPPRKNRKRH